MSKKTNAPFFSVIICTYNRANIISRALDSLILQTEKDWEGIIIDDGSKDSTQTVIQPYLEKHPIRYVKKKHSGLAPSRNTGMKIANGQYITFLDTDDEYAPEHLKIRHKVLTENPETDLLHSNVTIIGNPYLPDKNNLKKKIHINDCIVGGTFFIKKDSLAASQTFQNRYSDDSFFLEDMEKQGKEILKIDAPTYIYHRDMEDSISHQAHQ